MHDWTEHLFDSLKAAYGVQKIGAMWAGEDPRRIMDFWRQQLSRLPIEAREAALQDVIASGIDFPPTLPTFLAMCKAKMNPAHVETRALPPPRMPADRVRRNLEAVQAEFAKLAEDQKSRHPMYWAHRPKSAVAVKMLADGARRDDRLAAILRGHERKQGEDCRTTEAVKALLRFYDNKPDWYDLSAKRA